MKQFYHVYQFVVPLLFFPLAYWLWWKRFGHRHDVTMLVMFVPVVSYYVFVLVGILKLRLWRMNTRPTFRGVRPHHGFVIATASALFFYLCLRMVPVSHTGLPGILTSSFLGFSVFGFWNWWYETYAIKSGFISIYTKRVAEGDSAEEAVTDYAPILFGSLGACYGAFVKSAENLLLGEYSALLYWSIALLGGVSMIVVPAGLYELVHRLRYGESGLKSYVDVIEREKGA